MQVLPINNKENNKGEKNLNKDMARHHFVFMTFYLATYASIVVSQIFRAPEFPIDPPSTYLGGVNFNTPGFPRLNPNNDNEGSDFSVPEWPSFNADFSIPEIPGGFSVPEIPRDFSVPEWPFIVPELPFEMAEMPSSNDHIFLNLKV